MKSFTSAEIATLEQNYKDMCDAHNEITFDDVTQPILDELIELMQIVCGEAYAVQGMNMPRLPHIALSDLDASTFYGMVAKLTESARDLLVVARTRRV